MSDEWNSFQLSEAGGCVHGVGTSRRRSVQQKNALKQCSVCVEYHELRWSLEMNTRLSGRLDVVWLGYCQCIGPFCQLARDEA